jgi:ATP-dependent Clp protease ATP-binding subunit ClpC
MSDLQDYLKRQYVPTGPAALPTLADKSLGPYFMLHEIYGRISKKGGARAKPAIGERFTERAKAALELSQQEAERQRCGRIYAPHLLLGLAAEPGGLAGQALRELGITTESIREILAAHPQLTGPARDATDVLGIDTEVKQALKTAVQQAKKMSHDFIGTEHLLLGLLAHPQNKAVAAVDRLNVKPDSLRTRVTELIQQAKT